MENTTEKLLNFLCVEWGFCINQETADCLKNSQRLEVEEFTISILKAEGMNSDTEIEWKRKIKNKFIECFGSNTNA